MKKLILKWMGFLFIKGVDLHSITCYSYIRQNYELPTIIFWNVQSRHDNVPVRFNEDNVALVSGFSTNILSQVLGGEVTSPEEMMLSVLNKPEYDFVKEALK